MSVPQPVCVCVCLRPCARVCVYVGYGLGSRVPAEQSSDFLDVGESAADYFSRSNRRGSIVSDLDDLSIPDLDFVSGPGVPMAGLCHPPDQE